MSGTNVVVVMADAMRADRMSYFGYRRKGEKLTPNLDEVASDGAVFSRAYSTGGWTKDSQPAFLTGRYCSKMGWPGKETPLPEEVPTLGELFSSRGYETRAYNSSVIVRSELGFDRGFDHYEDICLKGKFEPDLDYMRSIAWNALHGNDNRTRYASKQIQKWVERRSSEKPFLLFWNPVNPHNKYQAPKKWRKKFEREPEPHMNEDAIDRVSDWGQCPEYEAGNLELSEEEMDVVKSRYDAEIAYLDHRIGELIQKLKDLGEWDDTIFVFTADHGENFGDYENLLYHNVALNEGLIRVPLIIAGPGVDDSEVEEPVSLIDLPNTILKISTGETEEGLDSRADMLGEDRREVVLAERDSDAPDSGHADELTGNKPPKPLEWYRKGTKVAIEDSSKLQIDSVDGETQFSIEGFCQSVTNLDENVASRLRERIEQLGPFSGEAESVDEDAVKQELEKLGYN